MTRKRTSGEAPKLRKARQKKGSVASEKRKLSPQAGRALGAVLLVVLLVAAVPVSGWLQEHFQQQEDGQASAGVETLATMSLEELLQTESAEALTSETAAQAAKLPEDFEAEFFSVASCADLQVSPEAQLVGFSSEQSAVASCANLSARMQEAGWTAVASGSEVTASFVKKEGRYRWALLSCVDVANSTSVVLQYREGEE